MPYREGNRLPGERASKLGHLEVIRSELVNDLINQFESVDPPHVKSSAQWQPIPKRGTSLRIVFAVDGSRQTLTSDVQPHKAVSFVKTALLRLDQNAVEKLDADAPHPMALRDIMSDAALYHATVFPLKGLRIGRYNTYHAIRRIIYDSLRDPSLGKEPYETLKWLAYEKWTDRKHLSPSFECPHCHKDVKGLPFDQDEGTCEHCNGDLFLSDMIGFHLEMGDDSAPEALATAYMLVHEVLLLFTGIRYFWQRQKLGVLGNALFLKDGPLTLRGQYSKLVIPIRRFLAFSRSKGVSIHLAGQEKTGAFTDHLRMIARNAPNNSLFVPDEAYIRTEIQHRPERAESYGLRTNFGNKVFVKLDDYHHFVLSVPTGKYTPSAAASDLIGLDDVLATLPSILSYRHECALTPIELANGVASLSSYPSAAVLKIFADI